MALVGLRAFAAGVAVGWAGRSVAGSTREALVRAVVAGHQVRNDLRRAVVERLEWIEDLMAEGRIRYEESVGEREPQPANDDGWPGSRVGAPDARGFSADANAPRDAPSAAHGKPGGRAA
jgi:hypothetical protein